MKKNTITLASAAHVHAPTQLSIAIELHRKGKKDEAYVAMKDWSLPEDVLDPVLSGRVQHEVDNLDRVVFKSTYGTEEPTKTPAPPTSQSEQPADG